jgi:hypothetical protein
MACGWCSASGCENLDASSRIDLWCWFQMSLNSSEAWQSRYSTVLVLRAVRTRVRNSLVQISSNGVNLGVMVFLVGGRCLCGGGG